jgi:methyltransferase (TIGR00027 family)
VFCGFACELYRLGTRGDEALSDSPVSNVSDTARWIAAYRATESARPDALFQDPYAALLAGERGPAIAALMPRQTRSGWPMVARTKLIDDIVQSAIAEGADCVINLAAGLDTRPYRLDLPGSLRWLEVDLPALIEEKEHRLAGAEPRCQLSRIKADLADPIARAAALRQAIGSSKRVLGITEGLLVYLDEPQVRALSADLCAEAAVRSWVIDLASPALLADLRKTMGKYLTNAPMKFAPSNGVAYFEALGWKVAAVHSTLHAAARFRRLPLLLRVFARFPEPDPRKPGQWRWYGVVKLQKNSHVA